MVEYFKTIAEHFDITVYYRGIPIFTDLGIHVDPENIVYWIKNYEQQHHTTTGKKISTFTQEDVDEVIATLVKYKLKEEVDPAEVHRANKKLAKQIFMEICAKR